LSSGLAGPSVSGASLSAGAVDCSASLAGSAAAERADASSDADDSGTGECVGAVAATSAAADSEGRGAAGGAGSLARGAVTEVSPVNGFLYSVADVMTSTEVGL
jgi:hypothetical protein